MQMTDVEKEKIVAMIEDFEKKSSVEFVPSFADRSSDYQFLRFLFSFIISVILSLFLGLFISWGVDRFWAGACGVAGLTLILYFAVSTHFLKMPLMDFQKIFFRKVYAQALYVFYQLKINQESNGNGLLLYVSDLEKKFYLLPDHVLVNTLGQSYWEEKRSELERLAVLHPWPEALTKFLATLFADLIVKFPHTDVGNNPNLISNSWVKITDRD